MKLQAEPSPFRFRRASLGPAPNLPPSQVQEGQPVPDELLLELIIKDPQPSLPHRHDRYPNYP